VSDGSGAREARAGPIRYNGRGRRPSAFRPLPGATLSAEIRIRRARTTDVRQIRALVDPLVARGVLLAKETVQLYEDVQEFWVAERSGRVVGCGAVHVMWEDLAEVRTLVVDDAVRGRGVGGRLLRQLLATASELGVRRVFTLTFEVGFFRRHGFEPIGEAPSVEPEVYAELLRSFDVGVAEFLDLEQVKPNTLGNTRMLAVLPATD
jgi:amino-acid N-acetyltransferase